MPMCVEVFAIFEGKGSSVAIHGGQVAISAPGPIQKASPQAEEATYPSLDASGQHSHGPPRRLSKTGVAVVLGCAVAGVLELAL